MRRTGAACGLIGLVVAVPSAGAPAFGSSGAVVLAGHSVAWTGDAVLADDGLAVAAVLNPDGTYAQGRIASTPTRDVVQMAGAGDGAGTGMLVMVERAPVDGGLGVHAADVATDGTVTGQDLVPPRAGVVVRDPAVAANARGDAGAVWVVHGTARSRARVMLARRAAGTAWGAPIAVSPPGTAGDAPRAPQVAVDGAGRVVVAWRARGVVVATGAIAGRIGPPRTLQTAAGPAAVAVAAGGGRTVVVWARTTGSGDVVVAAARRGAGPLRILRPLSVPTAGQFVERVAVAVGPDDTVAIGAQIGRGRTRESTRTVEFRASLASPAGGPGVMSQVAPFDRPAAGSSPCAAGVGPDGTAALMWRRRGAMMVALAGAGDTLGVPVSAGRAGPGTSAAMVGIAGGATTAWWDNGRVRVTTVTRS